METERMKRPSLLDGYLVWYMRSVVDERGDKVKTRLGGKGRVQFLSTLCGPTLVGVAGQYRLQRE